MYKKKKKIKEKIDRKFLKTFRDELIRMEGFSLATTEDKGIPIIESTNLWNTAFAKTCINTKNYEVLNYYDLLDWYESDEFDGEITDMMKQEHLILPTMEEIISEKLGIPESELVVCNECGGYFTEDMVVQIHGQNICLHCQDKFDSKGSANTIDYYVQAVKEVKKYRGKRENI